MEEKKELQMTDNEPVLKEFVKKSKDQKSFIEEWKKKISDNSHLLWLAGFVLVFAAVILVGILLCKAPAATMILTAILEAALSLCLCRTPVWLHGLVLAANILLGVIFHLTVLMLLACLVYLAGVFLLHVLSVQSDGSR